MSLRRQSRATPYDADDVDQQQIAGLQRQVELWSQRIDAPVHMYNEIEETGDAISEESEVDNDQPIYDVYGDEDPLVYGVNTLYKLSSSSKNLVIPTTLVISNTINSDPVDDQKLLKEATRVPIMVHEDGCRLSSEVNCSDPRILIAIERFNLKVFKNIVFLEYRTPVAGTKGGECDVAWRFRHKMKVPVRIFDGVNDALSLKLADIEFAEDTGSSLFELGHSHHLILDSDSTSSSWLHLHLRVILMRKYLLMLLMQTRGRVFSNQGRMMQCNSMLFLCGKFSSQSFAKVFDFDKALVFFEWKRRSEQDSLLCSEKCVSSPKNVVLRVKIAFY